VIDTDVVIAAMHSPTGASAAILRSVREGASGLLLTVPLALEYESVCSKAEHLLAAGLSESEAGMFVDAVIAMAEPVPTHFLWRPQLRDPNDEMVLEAAINGRADALVTFNVKDYGDAPGRFGVELMLPRMAIRRVRQ
jgi:putative PIN family toxin of toxin-antitoxin system